MARRTFSSVSDKYIPLDLSCLVLFVPLLDQKDTASIRVGSGGQPFWEPPKRIPSQHTSPGYIPYRDAQQQYSAHQQQPQYYLESSVYRPFTTSIACEGDEAAMAKDVHALEPLTIADVFTESEKLAVCGLTHGWKSSRESPVTIFCHFAG